MVSVLRIPADRAAAQTWSHWESDWAVVMPWLRWENSSLATTT
jgi:hypothetical protein